MGNKFSRAIKHIILGVALVWLLSGENLLLVQAGLNPSAPISVNATGPTIYIPFVMGGSGSAPTPVPTANPTSDSVLIAAGDIAKCGQPGDTATAALVQGMPGTVLALGDNAYDNGTAAEYATCYDPTWGAFKSRTRPIPGNHDYLTVGATGYYKYFGTLAGDPTKGYYSFDRGSWHIIAINSNCSDVGGCSLNNPQEAWLKADLASTTARCVLAYWHHPFFSSGKTGSTPQMATLYKDLYDAGADVLLSGHEHNYERFAPQNPTGGLDRTRGIVQFVVGTGGGNFTPLVRPLQQNSVASVEMVYGVLKLTLHPTSYTWEFISVDGSYSDSGTANCH